MAWPAGTVGSRGRGVCSKFVRSFSEFSGSVRSDFGFVRISFGIGAESVRNGLECFWVRSGVFFRLALGVFIFWTWFVFSGLD